MQKLALKLHKTILVSTHEIQLALQMANFIWIMTDSDLISGKPKTIIESDQINLLFDSKSIFFDKKSNQFLTI